MSLILVPSGNFKFRYNNEELTTETRYDEDDNIVAQISETDKVYFDSNTMSKDYEVYILSDYSDDPVNIVREKQMWFEARSSIVPSKFEVFEIYFEDKNGRKATHSVTDNELYSTEAIMMDAFKHDVGFNETFITYAGVHIKGSKEENINEYNLILDKMALSSSAIPHYCQPQEVVDFLGLRNNDGSPFLISNSTTPSYDVVADLICQAEEAIEQATRTSWTVKRASEELRNTGSVGCLSGSFGGAYMGLYQTSTVGGLANNFFRGIWCQLIHKDIKDIDGKKGDKLEIRVFGDQWRDITDSGMYWIDADKGGIYLRTPFMQKDVSVRATYRYGRDEVPEDMRRAAILFTCKHILQTGQLFRFMFPDTPESEDRWQKVALNFEYEYRALIKGRVDQVVIGGI